MTRTSKGIFWFPCFIGKEGELVFTEEIVARSVPCDEDGTPQMVTSFNSRKGCSYTHKDTWRMVAAGRREFRGIPWNYFPRGRVEISHGRALVYMNPQILNCEHYLERIKERFQIGHLDIRVKIDNSFHYQCTILEE